MADPAELQPVPAPPQAVPQAPEAETDTELATDTGSRFGLVDGNFVVNFAGQEWRLTKAQLEQKEIGVAGLRQPVPGLRFDTIKYRPPARQLTIGAGVDIPGLDSTAITVQINKKGKVSLSGNVQRDFSVPAIAKGSVTLNYTEDQGITGSATLKADAFAPKSISGLTAEGGGEITLVGGKLSGSGTVALTYSDLGNGTINFRFADGKFAADGAIHVTPPFLNAIDATLSVDEAGNITAETVVDVAGLKTPVPNLSLTTGTVTLRYKNATPSLEITNFLSGYAGLGAISIASLSLDKKNRPQGEGSFTANIPMLSEASGTVAVKGGKVSGSLTLGKDKFPESLPIKSGSITARLEESGALGLSGKMTADFGPAGKADLAASFGEQGFAIAGAADLTIPGLNQIHLTASYSNGDLSGEVQVPVNTALLPGLTGNVTVRYAQNRWTGETTLAYSADNGKLSGTVTITVAQAEDNSIVLGGTGSVIAQLMPGLEGKLTATILPAGGVDVSGEIVVTKPYELFPAVPVDKELFKYSQSIPLWAMLVAVIRVRAGIRAGIGPGVFRDIKVTGSYTIGSEATDPSFTISGEMYIPAFAEAYVSFGAGLGLDVVLGSLTGGIEGVATAGVYGAISVVPELSYQGGDWAIDGTATLAAGARLKLGLNAWAEVEAFWVTVWDDTWKLTEFVMPIGPDLSLQANMHYVFGQPQAPTLELKTSDIDTDALIRGAMPEDGPAASGAREALQNKAEWKGKLREKREPPPPPPPATPPVAAPPVPARKPKSGGPPPGATTGAPGAAPALPSTPAPGGGGANPSPAQAATTDVNAKAAATPDPNAGTTVPDSQLPTNDKPRYPTGVSLDMLKEPPVPEGRSPAQMSEDLATAQKLVELASGQAGNSDVLDDSFPLIKNRLRLTSLGYEGDFEKGFQVVGTINPKFKIKVHEPLTGSGLTQGLGRQTNIVYGSTDFGGDTAGITMVAMPLGPDHPEGSGPSGQSTLMNKLPTDPATFKDAQSRFIRGHLLNDWLGGEGRARNLFPITAHANTLHSAKIEEALKEWVNEKRYWVKYQVTITVRDDDYDLGPVADDNYVNSTLVAEASVLDTELKPVSSLTRKMTFSSVYKNVATVKENKTENAAALAAHKGRQVDLNIKDEDVLGTSRKTDAAAAPVFPDDLEEAVKASVVRVGKDTLKQRLKDENGWGPAYIDVLWNAYEFIKRKDDKTLNNLNPDEARNFRAMVTRWRHEASPLIKL